MISLSCLLYTVNAQNPHVSPSTGKNSPERYNPKTVSSFLSSLGHKEAGGCTEIRIFPKERYLKLNGSKKYVGKTVAGYYTDYEKAARDIAPFDGVAAIYVTLNPCDPKLMRRGHNRLQYDVETTAEDKDIQKILWVPLDLDPVRPKGTSSSDDELQGALLRFDQIHSEVFAPHLIPVIPGMSGNGAHGLIRLRDCPNNPDTQDQIKRFLDFLKDKYSDSVVNVDSSVSNPSRIWKIYGTMACKGDNTPEAPHRRASLSLPSEILPIDLSSLVAVIPSARDQREPNASSKAQSKENARDSQGPTSQEKASFSSNNPSSGRMLSDEEIIGKLLLEKNPKWERLLNGDTRDYPSKSEADAALVFKLAFYTKDAAQISRLFRRSGLMYDKWDEVHYADGRTYGQKLISDALQKVTGQYQSKTGQQKTSQKQKEEKGAQGKQQGNGSKERGGAKQSQKGFGSIPTLEVISGNDLLALSLPEPQWAVDSLIPQGLSILAGRPKVGKSWLAFDSAIAVACGGYVLGQFPAKQGEALFIGLEDTLRRLKDRLQKLATDGEEIPDLSRLYVSTALPRGNGGLVALENWLKTHPDCRLVVIDTLARYLPKKTGRRSEYDEDYDLLAPLQQLAHAHSIALVLIHHTRKLVSDHPIDDLLGSTGLSGVPDGLLVIRRTTDGTTLHVTGKDVDTQDLAVRFEKETGHWWYLGDAETHAITRERKEILDLLALVDEPMTPTQIAQELSKKRTAVQMLLTKMARQGVVRCVGRGKYVIEKENHTAEEEKERDLFSDDRGDRDDSRDEARTKGNGRGDFESDNSSDYERDDSGMKRAHDESRVTLEEALENRFGKKWCLWSDEELHRKARIEEHNRKFGTAALIYKYLGKTEDLSRLGVQ